MRIASIILIFSIVLPFHGLNAGMPKKNTAVFDEYAGIAAASIADFVVSKNIAKIVIRAVPQNISFLVVNPLINTLSGKNIAIMETDSSGNAAVIELTVRKAFVAYESYLDDDSLARRIEFMTEGTMKYNGYVMPLPIVERLYTDIISREDIAGIEDKSFDYARAAVPEKDNWFYNTILEPAIVLGTTAITIILLFTVRSQ